MPKTMRALLCAAAVLSAPAVFAQSLQRLRGVSPGYDRLHILSATVEPRYAGYRDGPRQEELGRRLVERLSGLPGVRSASVGLIMSAVNRST